MARVNTHLRDLTERINLIANDKVYNKLLLTKVLNEQFLSDFLAWSLDSRASHGWNSKFLKRFVKLIAEKRTDNPKSYDQSSKRLKIGKSTTGVLASKLKVGNATVIRELHFAKSFSLKTNFVDIAVLDFDKADDYFITIENKLFGNNTNNQLKKYQAQVEQQYATALVQEYVYLTIDGKSPKGLSRKTKSIWVALSWLDDMLPILMSFVKTSTHSVVNEVIEVLSWIKRRRSPMSQELIDEVRQEYLSVVGDIILYDLNRYQQNKTNWIIDKITTSKITFKHSSTPRSYLDIALMSNMDIAFGGSTSDGELFSRHIVPFGIPKNQLVNLVEFFVRQMYRQNAKKSWARQYVNRHKNKSEYLSNHRSQNQFLSLLEKIRDELSVLNKMF